MALYPEHDILRVKESESGDLLLENDSFWFPSYTHKLFTEFFETKLQKTLSTSISGCCNAFVIPANYKDTFYANFGDQIQNGILKIKTNYNIDKTQKT